MIKGVHAMLFSADADKTRAFLRDVIGFPFTDDGTGWLIFEAPAADVGVHPGEQIGHSVSMYCDDLDATMSELKGRGATFAGPVREQDWGRVVMLELPGAGQIEVYQPKY